MAGVICGDYELRERAGETEYAIVFRGQHTHIPDRLRAVKIPQWEPPKENPAESELPFRPDALKRIFAEFCMAAGRIAAAADAATPEERGKAAHVAHVESVRPDVEMPYIVSEWAAGESVAAMMARGPVVPAEAARIAAEALEGLAFAHAHGIVHGAIKPSNLLLTARGEVRLADFGANGLLPGFPLKFGSSPYLSPEQQDPAMLAGEDLDARADLYSLTAVLFEMLTGHRLPRVLSANALPSRAAPQVPTVFDEVIVHGLQVDRRARFATADEMRSRVLEAVGADLRQAVVVTAPSQMAVPAAVGAAAGAYPEWPAEAESDGRVTLQEAASAEAPGEETQAEPPKPARRAGEVRINQADNAEMVWVPGGTLRMGSDIAAAEGPVHEIEVEGFWIYRYPITQAQYSRFMRATGDARPRPSLFKRGDEHANKAAAGVRWEEARTYCRWAGARLPTEAEWEWAARGPRNPLYPWGDSPNPGMANTAENGLYEQCDVNRYPQGASWCGAVDMVGNVFEWCSTVLRPYPYSASDGREDAEATGPRVLRGGSANTTSEMARATFRCPPGSQTSLTGFRPVVTGD